MTFDQFSSIICNSYPSRSRRFDKESTLDYARRFAQIIHNLRTEQLGRIDIESIIQALTGTFYTIDRWINRFLRYGSESHAPIPEYYRFIYTMEGTIVYGENRKHILVPDIGSYEEYAKLIDYAYRSRPRELKHLSLRDFVARYGHIDSRRDPGEREVAYYSIQHKEDTK